MKRLIILLTLLISLSACGNATTNISNKDDALLKVGTQTITLGQVYGVMLSSDPSGVVRTMALQIILDEEVEITADMETKADEELESFLENVGDSVDMYLSYYGFKDIDEYRLNGILFNLRQEALVKLYIESKFDALIVEYQPRKVRILEILDPETADVALAEIKAGGSFEDVANTYGDGTFYGEEILINTSSALPFLIKEFVNVQATPTLSEVLPDVSSNFIVQLTVADPYKMLEEVKQSFLEDQQFIEMAIESYMREYQFTIYDKTIFDIFLNQYPSYLGE